MIMNYVTKIRAKVNIYASKKSSNLFDGSYKSIYQGNGLDFENLREYIPGDNIRDIDWKASSRSGKMLVKRYVAEKKHNIMIVWDSGKKMIAHTKGMEIKKDLALNVGGIVGYLAAQNGDNVGALYNRNGMIQYHPLRTGMHNIERILTTYDKEHFEGYDSNLEKNLEYIVKNIQRKMIIFVISDAIGIRDVSESTLKKLVGRHDVLFVRIGDANYTDAGRLTQKKGEKNASAQGKKMKQASQVAIDKKKNVKQMIQATFNMEKDAYIPEFISGNKKLMKLEQEAREKLDEANADKLLQYRIISTEIDNEEEMVDKIVELLEGHRYANSR